MAPLALAPPDAAGRPANSPSGTAPVAGSAGYFARAGSTSSCGFTATGPPPAASIPSGGCNSNGSLALSTSGASGSCNFTNQAVANLTVQKNTLGGGGSFSFSASGGIGTFTLITPSGGGSSPSPPPILPPPAQPTALSHPPLSTD